MAESVIRIKADAAQAVSQLAALRGAVNSAYGALDKQAETLKEVRANQKSLNQINKISSSLIKKLNKDLIQFTKRQKESKTLYKQQIAGLRALNSQFSRFSMRLRQGTRDMQGFALAVRNSGKNLQFMGRSIMIGMLPFLNGIRNASRFAKSLEEAEIRLAKIADLTTSELAPVADELLKISEAFGVSRDLITDIAADFALVGFPVDQLHNLASAANELAILGQIDVGPAKDIFVSTVFAMRNMATLKGEVLSFADATKQATGQMYLFNIVNNNTALAISDLAESIPKLVPITTQFGLTITEAAGALAAMKASGVSANEGTTALRTGLLRLTSLTKQADEKVAAARSTLEDFNFEAGVGVETIASFGDSITAVREQISDAAAFDIVKNILGIRQTAKVQLFVLDMQAAADQIDTTLGIMQGMSDVDPFAGMEIDSIKDFAEASRQATQPMKDAAVAMIRDNTAMSNVTSQFLRGLIIQMAGVENAAEMSEEEIQKVLDSDAWKMQQAKNHMKNALADLGGQINMLLVDHILPIVNKVVNGFNNLSDSTKKWIVIIAGVVGAFGPVLYMMAIIKMAFGQTLNIIAGAVGKIIAKITSSTTAGIAAANQEQAAIALVTQAKMNETMATHSLTVGELKLAAARRTASKAAAAEAAAGALTGAGPAAGLGIGGLIGSKAPHVTGMSRVTRARVGVRRMLRPFTDELRDPTALGQPFRARRGFGKGGRFAAATRQGRLGQQAGLFRRGFKDPMHGLTQDPSAWQRLIRPGHGAGSYRDAATGRFRGPLTPGESARRWRAAGSSRFVSPGGRPAGGIGPPLPHSLRGAGLSQRIGYNLGQFRDARFGGAFAAGAKPPGGIGPRLPFGRGVRATGDPGATRVLGQQALIGAKAMGRTGMGKIATQATKFKGILKGLPKILGMIFKPIKLIKTIFTLINPMALVFGLAIGIAAAVFATIKGDFENFKKAMEPGLAALKEAWGALMEGIKAIIKPIVDLFNKFSFGAKKGETQGTSLGKKLSAALKPITILLKIIAGLFQAVGFAIGIAVDIAQPVLNYLFNLITPIVEIVKSVIALFRGDFEQALQHLKRAAGSIIISIIRIFGTLFEWIVKGMMSFTHVTEGAIRLLAKIPGMGFLNNVADGIQGWRDQVNGFAGDLVDGVINQVGNLAGIEESEMFGFRDEEVRDIAGEAGSLFAGEANDAAREGLESTAPGMYDATNSEAGVAGEEAGKTFVDHFWSAFKKFAKEFMKQTKNFMKEQHEELLAAFDGQTQAMSDMYQSQIDGIQEVIKEEQRLSREVAYQTKRRDMIRDRALDNDAYRRNRALAIYEGRIDDARSLDLKEKKEKEEGSEKLTEFDYKRAQTLLSEQRKANMDQLEEERRHWLEINDVRRTALADGLALLLENIPVNKDEWDKYFNEPETGLLALTETAFSGMLDSMPTTGDFDYTGITSDMNSMKDGVVGAWDGITAKLDEAKLYLDPDDPDNPASMAVKLATLANEALQEQYEWTPETGFLSWLVPYMDAVFAVYEERIADFKATHADFLAYISPPEEEGSTTRRDLRTGEYDVHTGSTTSGMPGWMSVGGAVGPAIVEPIVKLWHELLPQALQDELHASGALTPGVGAIDRFVDPSGQGRGYFEVLANEWMQKAFGGEGGMDPRPSESETGWLPGTGITRSDFVETLRGKDEQGFDRGEMTDQEIDAEIFNRFGANPEWLPEVVAIPNVVSRVIGWFGDLLSGALFDGTGTGGEWRRTAEEVMATDPSVYIPDATKIVTDAITGERRIVYEGVPTTAEGQSTMDTAIAQQETGGTGSGGGFGVMSGLDMTAIDPQNLLPKMGGVHSDLIGGVLEMSKEASRRGLDLTASGNRSMFDQERLFNDRYNPITVAEGYDPNAVDGKGVDYVPASKAGGKGDKVWDGVTYRYHGRGTTGTGEVAVPGTSMHGSGEAVDISGPDNQKTRRHTFMDNWSGKHGVYTPLAHEPWHWERTNGPRSLRGYFNGGLIDGPGSAARMIKAHGQEFVMSAAATRRIGLGALNNMNNYAKFTGPNSAGGGTTNTSSSNVTIYVDTFIGERGWFEKMMSDYNVNVAPSSERVRGIEQRTVGSYTDSNTRSRV